MFDLLDKLHDAKVLVLGDIILDRYWWGDVTRISPEAPVPVVRLNRTTSALGGAANVAANIAGLGGSPTLVGCIGDDPEGSLIPELCREADLSAEHLTVFDSRLTTVKTRVIAHHQQVARVDQEFDKPLSPEDEETIISMVKNLLPTVHAVAVSDYSKGLLTERVLSAVIQAALENDVPVLVDPKARDYSRYRGASLITPNRREAAEACNIDDRGTETVTSAGQRLMSEHGFPAVLITEGEAGLTLFRERASPVHLDATARDVFDVTGAGDTVLAAVSVAMAAYGSLVDAAKLANAAAGLSVEKVGTAVVTADMLRSMQQERELQAGK